MSVIGNRIYRFLLLSVIALGEAAAWQGPPVGKHYPVAGSVIDTATGQPIRRALVRIVGGHEESAAFTDATGRFEFASAPAGDNFVSAQRPGYADPPSSRDGVSAGGATVQIGLTVPEIRIGLMPTAKLTGMITDGDGDPIPNVDVELFGSQISQGRREWVSRGFATTDDTGRYKMGNELPGDAIVCAANRANATALRSVLPECFSGQTDFDSADVISLSPGKTALADFTLAVSPGFTINGAFSGASGVDPISIWAESNAGLPGRIGSAAANSATSEFALRGVPSGAWRLHFAASDRSSRPITATQEVEVRGADLHGLRIDLQPGAYIPITILGADNDMPVQVHLVKQPDTRIPIDSRQKEYWAASQPSQDGETTDAPHLELTDVEPGRYAVFAETAGLGACLASTAYGSTDLQQEPLEVAPGSGDSPPIVITLRHDCATLEVNVSSRARSGEALILLLPNELKSEPRSVPVPIDAQGKGKAAISSIAPGNYHVYAFSDLSDVEYMNPDAMSGFPGQAVQLDANAKASVRLTVVEQARP